MEGQPLATLMRRSARANGMFAQANVLRFELIECSARKPTSGYYLVKSLYVTQKEWKIFIKLIAQCQCEQYDQK